MKVKIVCALVSLNLMGSAAYAAGDLQFNPAFLKGEGSNIADLSWVNAGGKLPAGEYNINVYVNNNYAFTGNIQFRVNKQDSGSAPAPCITPEQITAMGIDIQQAKGNVLPLTQQCYFLNSHFPGTTLDFDQKTLTVNISVPQHFMLNLPRGYVSPESWESGITSAWFNYVINGSNNTYEGESRTRQDQLFASLNSGVNVGAWRLRDFTTWTKENNQLSHVQTYLQRDLPALRSQVYVGETYTSAQIFDSVGLRGVALATDDNMLPASLSGYAPEVRGIARSNATVTVRQNGNIIYQTSVSAGEFVLKDLYPTASGGDLSVTVTGSDGSKTQYAVPFASVPNLVRAGQFKYSLGAGTFRGTSQQNSPEFLQGEMFLGWKYGLTLYGGVQAAQDYTALSLGVGQNMGRFGAYSLDVIHARSTLADGNSYDGDSVRLRYSKLISDVGTRLNFYSWRFSTEGFYTLGDTAYKRMNGGSTQQVTEADGTVTTRYENLYDLRMSRKSKNQLLLSQPMGGMGSLTLSWDQQTYWNTPKSTQGLQFAWNNTYRNVSVGLNFQRSTSLYDNKKDNIVSLSLSVPLGNPAYSTRVRYSGTQADSTGATHSVGLSGYVPGKDNVFYSVSQRYSEQQQYGGDTSLQYQGQRGDYNLGYSYSAQSRNLSYGMSGGAVLHEDGLTLSQPLGNTNILVKAPGAADVAVSNHRGIKTDSRGYAVIPYATPYRVNRVELDVTTAGHDVELDNAVINKTPTDGAMVRAVIPARIGMKAMLVMRHNTSVLPFGTVVSLLDSQTDSSSIVGDNGSLYLSGLPQKGTLKAVWGTGSGKSCQAVYRLDKQHYNPQTGLYSQEVTCQ
ncbi:fimbria/pilus outer membrane usher protein [Rahnella victoriana]|uniref:Fimbrial biogenesis outer membrane usher protein n=1 Tax=Rahnella victoriana TaxID=1510570 RepID=A0ABS0DSP3_9GAMM|nr:fimbria/pilus outer membrane usher protein [Rahnella victoriana]MBF7956845.1 fimbrial biogenesis outer membrane usher protein [Rahnella victoriana]